jgi:putative protein kinase ArgK-like GTPase of G3E family
LGDSVDDLLQQFGQGNKRAAARLISLVEDGRPEAFVILERLDKVEAQLEHLRHGVRQLLADVDGDQS